MVYERIKYIYYNNNRTIGYRLMKIFLQRYGIYLSTTTIHKYMNKDLNLSAIVMRKKPGYKVSAKYCYATHELRLHQNDRCKRFTLF